METTSTQVKKIDFAACVTACDAAARRAMDITASALGLLFLAPFFLVIAVLIKRDSPGPVFYHGPRLGKNGRIFGIVKFRTMYERKESYDGPRITATGDSRITPLGHWLRDTKVNELPQLWNVLMGDMSLVGPRPEDPEIARGWSDALRDSLLAVRPGITSPATVIFRREEELLQSANVLDDYLRTILPDKLRLDLIYIRKRSLLTDVDVIFMTLLLLLPRLRRAAVPESALYWGPLAQFVSRSLNWFILDTLVAFLAMGAAAAVWRISAPLMIGVGYWVVISLLVGLCFSVINSTLGLSHVQWQRAPSWEVIPLGLSAICSTLLLIVIDFGVFHQWHVAASRPHLPLGMLVLTGLLSFLGFTAARYRERLLTGFAAFWLCARGAARKTVGERVLLIGAGNNSQLATWLLTRSEFAQLFSIVGMVDDDPRKQGLNVDGFRVIGTTRDIPALIEKNSIGLAIFTISRIDQSERERILNVCQSARTHVIMFPDVMSQLTMVLQPSAALPGRK